MFFYFYGKLTVGCEDVCMGAENFQERSGGGGRKDDFPREIFSSFSEHTIESCHGHNNSHIVHSSRAHSVCSQSAFLDRTGIGISRPRVYWTLIFNIFRGTRKRQQQISVLQDETDVEFSFCFLLWFFIPHILSRRGGKPFPLVSVVSGKENSFFEFLSRHRHNYHRPADDDKIELNFFRWRLVGDKRKSSHAHIESYCKIVF